MGDYMGDLGKYNAVSGARTPGSVLVKNNNEKLDMDMQDFLMLMVTEMQHQSIDSTADTSEMLNQLVMMQMVSAMTNMTDASIMGYSASLVGKTVTVAEYDQHGKMQEVVGEVTATGTLDGKQVIFVNDKYYHLNDIIAVGKLPEKPEKPEKPDGSEEKPDGTDSTEKPDGTEKPEQKPDGSEKPEAPAAPDVKPPVPPEVNTPEVPDIEKIKRRLHL